MANRIDNLLLQMRDYEASDLHIVVGQPPKFRVHGEVTIVEGEPEYDKDTVHDTMFEILNEDQAEKYEQGLDFDFAYGIPGQARFRCNYFFQRTGYGSVFRIIPEEISTLEELGLPKVISNLTRLRSGLVLVTGPTGSGKSTTLAAMINEINERESRHIQIGRAHV